MADKLRAGKAHSQPAPVQQPETPPQVEPSSNLDQAVQPSEVLQIEVPAYQTEIPLAAEPVAPVDALQPDYLAPEVEPQAPFAGHIEQAAEPHADEYLAPQVEEPEEPQAEFIAQPAEQPQQDYLAPEVDEPQAEFIAQPVEPLQQD
ncbi:MAG: hypothetical protein HKN11_21465, partial [Rhizobiales bacterium]|nr:hypothetical protein [Hyphomicrobiales bacterium]